MKVVVGGAELSRAVCLQVCTFWNNRRVGQQAGFQAIGGAARRCVMVTRRPAKELPEPRTVVFPTHFPLAALNFVQSAVKPCHPLV